MASNLQIGQRLTGVVPGTVYSVAETIGEGGQGVVVRARGTSGDIAVKWFFQRSATTRQRLLLEKMLAAKAPSEHYLWPLDIVKADGVDGFGYVMRLRPESHVSISMVRAMHSRAPLTNIVVACRNLAVAFRALHLKGLAYFDIKGDNGFLDPETGDILICDVDNITFSGDKTPIEGTITHMPPELIVGKAKPSTKTDLHSLAVLLFEMLVRSHPLEGRLESAIEILNPAEQVRLYGKSPVFIFDPKDLSNRPDPDWHVNATVYWSLLPKFVRDEFVKAFTVGLHDPNQRTVESRWIETFVRLQNCITVCSSCGAEIYTEPESANPIKCWACSAVSQPPRRLVLIDPTKPKAPELHRIMLHAGAGRVPATRIYRDHLTPMSIPNDRGEPVGIVEARSDNRNVIGLKNETSGPWSVTFPSGKPQPLEPGKRATIQPGVEIRFAGSNLVGRVE